MSSQPTWEGCLEAFGRRDYIGCYKALGPLLAAGKTPVVTGYIGATQGGEITTMQTAAARIVATGFG